MTDDQKWQVLHGLLCATCGSPTELRPARMYFAGAHESDYVRACPVCPDCYVGCHHGTKNALGRTANLEHRRWKMRAHDAFDKLWKSAPKKVRLTRHQAYSWLAKTLDIPSEFCHIGMFSVKTCMRVVHEVQKYLEREDPWA